MEKAILPIKKHNITEVGFNHYDFYYRINETYYVWCVCWADYLKKSENYVDWYIRVPINEIQTYIDLI